MRTRGCSAPTSTRRAQNMEAVLPAGRLAPRLALQLGRQQRVPRRPRTIRRADPGGNVRDGGGCAHVRPVARPIWGLRVPSRPPRGRRANDLADSFAARGTCSAWDLGMAPLTAYQTSRGLRSSCCARTCGGLGGVRFRAALLVPLATVLSRQPLRYSARGTTISTITQRIVAREAPHTSTVQLQVSAQS